MKIRWATTTALAAAVALGTTGCTFGAEIATNIQYEPSDGTGTTVGDLAIRNALLITDDGETLNLVMTVANSADEGRALTVQWEVDGTRESQRIRVGGGESVRVGDPEETQILIEGVDVVPGSLYPVFFQYGDEPGSELLVPVLDGELPEYELYVPSE